MVIKYRIRQIRLLLFLS